MKRFFPNPEAHAPKPAPGYTLVEVLVTVVIIGIAGIVIVPSMLQAGTLGLQGAARHVIADLLYAQNEAVAAGEPRGVIFDILENRYRVVRPDGNDADTDPDTITMGWINGQPNNYITDFRNDRRFTGIALITADFDGGSTIWFDALGTPLTDFNDPGSTTQGTVVLAFQTQRITVNLTPITGRITVTGGG